MSNWKAFLAAGKKAPTKPTPSLVPPAPANKQAHQKQKSEPASKPSAAATMSILDESTSASSDVPIRAQPTAPHKGGSTPALEAARLRAMRSLSELFQQRCEALGGRKHYAHFEAWLWAARNESAARIVPPIPQRASAAARLELSRKLTSAGLTPADARAACDALDTRCAQLAEQLRHAETTDRAPPRWGGVNHLSCGLCVCVAIGMSLG